MTTPKPGRFVTVNGDGWHLQGGAYGTTDTYVCFTHPDERYETGEALSAVYGPLRVVRGPTDDERATLRGAWTQAGAFAPAAVVLAWARCLRHAGRPRDGLRGPRTVPPGLATAAIPELLDHLTAGRPGSWEASLAREIVGYLLRIHQPQLPTVEARSACLALRDLYLEWVFGAETYVEVPETTAGLVGDLIDSDEEGYGRYEILAALASVHTDMRSLLASHAWRTEHGAGE